ncbi:MAG: small multi-drug export protein [Oscillospiraceae bacterium]|nr:small multi-drug export protein [Oscillospiraceae bacterium]
MNFKNYFWVFFVSMLPLIELRGAVPIGVGMGLPFIPTYLIAAFGNMLPVPVILLLVKPVLQFMAKFKIFTKLVNYVMEKGHAAGAKFGNAKYWALYTFVAIPLPGTGAWTGSLAAALLDLDKGKSFMAVLAGVLTAGVIMGVVSYGLLGTLGLVF